MIYLELNDYDNSIKYCDLMLDEVKKSLNRNYGASNSYAYGLNLREEAVKRKELAQMNAVSRFKKLHPIGFYSTATILLGAISGAAFFMLNKHK